MKFSIRDDDICYHTRAEDIVELYGDISRTCPVSFSCIPYVGGYPIHDYQQRDWHALDLWWRERQTCEIYDIAKNKELVSLLSEWVKDGRATIMLHGIHHSLYEFDTKRDMTNEIKLAREHLSNLFGCPVVVATPPNNTLSAMSAKSLAVNNMNVLVAYGHTPFEREISPKSLWSFLKLFYFFLKNGKRLRYPHPLEFSQHKEQACYHLGPEETYEELKLGLDYAHQENGNFVIGTHFYHLLADDVLRSILDRLVKRASLLTGDDSCFVTTEHLFE